MIQEQIHKLFKQGYNQANWKQFLNETFSNARLLAKPESLTGINSSVANKVLKLGYIMLDENGIERKIAVFEVELAKGIILERNRVGLRNLLRRYWKNIDAAFIVYHNPNDCKWRFTYVSELTGYNADGEFVKITTEPKRYTYVLGEGESTRTAAERFALIAKKGSQACLEDVKNAFSVEKLSKAFFDEYKKQYEGFCDFMIKKPGIKAAIFNGDEKAIRDFNKKLLGRIVFLYFIQKKGWMGVPVGSKWGQGDFNFLSHHFDQYKNQDLFYQEFLCPLFFETLNKDRKSNNDVVEFIKEPCRIPYLNGGLFEEDDKKQRNVVLDAQLFRNLFDFFNQYNFTIYEDDPNDHTVAVDPEMLGHIFENLLEDNKDKGAFYTPKEIVHYMCQESLIEYLTTYFENKGYKITGYIGYDKPTQAALFSTNECRTGQLIIENKINSEEKQIDRLLIEKLLKKKLDDDDKKLVKEHSEEFHVALDSVKICDPAIGSGAFPMGLLMEIFTAKQTLWNFEHGNLINFPASQIKLNIIQNSIYGVDIEKGAVDIARLRFWLSLVVDEEEPKALPNLDYKIVVGNSLVSKLGDDIIDIDWNIRDDEGFQTNIFGSAALQEEKKNLLKKIGEEQKKYFKPDSNKKKLAADIRRLKIDLLINQLELMVTTKGVDTKSIGTGKKIVEQNELYFQTIGWKASIRHLNKLKEKPDQPLDFFDWKLDFPEVLNELISPNVGFDIVIANPPYDVYEGKKKVEIAGLLSFQIYHKCKGGKINAYELFLAKSDELVTPRGTNCQIFQNAFLADNSSRGVRNHYLTEQTIKYIDSFPERDDLKKRVFESAKMSVCILMSKKQKIYDYNFSLRIHSDRTLTNFYTVNFLKSEIYAFDPVNIVIPLLGVHDKQVFTNYHKSKSLELFSNRFECLEGELNMTFHKQYMTSNSKNPLIVKGAQIQRYFVTNNPSQGTVEYVDRQQYISDYPNSKKAQHHKQIRVVLQGISGANDKIRIISTIIEKNVFCANSCNYVIAKQEDVSLYCLLGIVNSKFINWVFRKTSTNSNVNCYEVNNLKIPKTLSKQSEILEEIVKAILTDKKNGADTTKLEQQIDCIVYRLYALSHNEVKLIDPEFSLSKAEYESIKLE